MKFKLIQKFDTGGTFKKPDGTWDYQMLYEEYKKDPTIDLSTILTTPEEQDQFYQYVSQQQLGFPEITSTPEKRQQTTTSYNTPVVTTSSTATDEEENPYDFKPVDFSSIQLPEPPEKEPWSDWIPFGANLAHELISADRQAEIKKKLRFPLKEVPFLQHAVTNDYHLRTGLQQQANELRTLGQYRSNSSDLNQNLRNMQQYDIKASEIENQAEQHKADTFAKESQISEQVANQNKVAGVEGANFDTQQNANAWNNIEEANAQRDLRRTKAIQDFTDKMSTSHGQYVLDNKLNNNQYLRGLHQYQASLDQQQYYNDYLKATNSDYKESQAYAQFLADIENAGEGPGRNGIVLPGDSARLENPDTKEAYLQELWNGEFGRKYREQVEKEKADALNNYLMAMQTIGNRLAAANLMLKARLNNQGTYTRPDYSSAYIPVYGYARGGSVRARYIDYQNHINRQQQFSSRGSLDRQKVREKRLATDLDRISKEQMILLRSIFK